MTFIYFSSQLLNFERKIIGPFQAKLFLKSIHFNITQPNFNFKYCGIGRKHLPNKFYGWPGGAICICVELVYFSSICEDYPFGVHRCWRPVGLKVSKHILFVKSFEVTLYPLLSPNLVLKMIKTWCLKFSQGP